MRGVRIEIRELHAGDEAVLASAPARQVFDDELDIAATRQFLADPHHHIVVALDEGVVVGFISAVRYHHPDKPAPELWLNEVGVAATHHRRAIGKELMAAILDVGRRHGCTEAWVLTDRANEAANRLYASVVGAEAPEECLMYSFPIVPER